MAIASAGIPALQSVTYSAAYTLVPTYECFNRCQYCNFRTNPGTSEWLSLQTATEILRSLGSGPFARLEGVSAKAESAITEILILSGEVHPKSPLRSAWFHHIYDLCKLALSFGFLPHTNVGPLSQAEMQCLKTVNVSMGLMLEQLTPSLLRTVHRYAPSKVPELRVQQLTWAGELRIPFTTGLLLGIGETADDRADTLTAIAHSHQQWGHIQEVILQPYSPGSTENWGGAPFPLSELVETVRRARQILPPDITIQIPPNLVRSPEILLACLEAGARDLGGICPRDEVNPDYAHPLHTELSHFLTQHGWTLTPRLPVYPRYDAWLAAPLKLPVQVQRLRLTPRLPQ